MDGVNGKDGVDGKDGIDGKDGTNGVDGKDGIDGKDGEKGEKGDKGSTGSQGPKGDQGITGTPGENGKDGTSFISDEGIPSSALGKNGDTYLDTTTFNLYVKENGNWILKGNIKGEKGDKGDKGDNASSSSSLLEEGTYLITITQADNGTIYSNKTTANELETVKLKFVPDEDMRLEKIFINEAEQSFSGSSLGSIEGPIDLEYIIQNENIVVSAIFSESMI